MTMENATERLAWSGLSSPDGQTRATSVLSGRTIVTESAL